MTDPNERPYCHIGIQIQPYRKAVEKSDENDILKDGFIFVESLTPRTFVVQSVRNGNLYVKRIIEQDSHMPNKEIKDKPSEIRFSTSVDAEYKLLRPLKSRGRGKEQTRTYFNQVVLWQTTEDKTFAVYSEFCNGGTLGSLYDKYHELKRPVPEHFIWHFLLTMIESLRYLHCGIRPDADGAAGPADWDPIYHRDITFENVVLHYPPRALPEPRAGHIENAFPDLVLVNFGSAAAAGSDDPKTAKRGRWGKIWEVGARRQRFDIIAAWQDVYAVFNVAKALCLSSCVSEIPMPEQFPCRNINASLDVDETPYTDSLIDLLTACSEWPRQDRSPNPWATQFVPGQRTQQQNWMTLPTLNPGNPPGTRSRKPDPEDIIPDKWWKKLDVSWTKPEIMPFEYIPPLEVLDERDITPDLPPRPALKRSAPPPSVFFNDPAAAEANQKEEPKTEEGGVDQKPKKKRKTGGYSSREDMDEQIRALDDALGVLNRGQAKAQGEGGKREKREDVNLFFPCPDFISEVKMAPYPGPAPTNPILRPAPPSKLGPIPRIVLKAKAKAKAKANSNNKGKPATPMTPRLRPRHTPASRARARVLAQQRARARVRGNNGASGLNFDSPIPPGGLGAIHIPRLRPRGQHPLALPLALPPQASEDEPEGERSGAIIIRSSSFGDIETPSRGPGPGQQRPDTPIPVQLPRARPLPEEEEEGGSEGTGTGAGSVEEGVGAVEGTGEGQDQGEDEITGETVIHTILEDVDDNDNESRSSSGAAGGSGSGSGSDFSGTAAGTGTAAAITGRANLGPAPAPGPGASAGAGAAGAGGNDIIIISSDTSTGAGDNNLSNSANSNSVFVSANPIPAAQPQPQPQIPVQAPAQVPVPAVGPEGPSGFVVPDEDATAFFDRSPGSGPSEDSLLPPPPPPILVSDSDSDNNHNNSENGRVPRPETAPAPAPRPSPHRRREPSGFVVPDEDATAFFDRTSAGTGASAGGTRDSLLQLQSSSDTDDDRENIATAEPEEEEGHEEEQDEEEEEEESSPFIERPAE